MASTGIVRLLVPVPAPSLFITSLNVLADDKADQLTCYALHTTGAYNLTLCRNPLIRTATLTCQETANEALMTTAAS